MFGAVEVASLFGTLELRDTATGTLRQFDSALDRTAQGLQSIGSNLTRVGSQITAITAPLAIGLGAAANQAMDFDRSMTNVGAVLGYDRDQMDALRSEILAIGGASQAGPQAAAQAFYDIAGGVLDANSRMAVFNAAIATSEAGAASLSGTVSAFISVMNAYKYGADQATYVSDVLTRTVAVGVGTMDQFAAAFPAVTGLAAQLGIEFEHVGAMASYLTTKGYSAGQSTDYLRGAMIALINPNADMEAALAAIGAESGSAAIEMYGLAGTYQRLQRAFGSTDALSSAVGRVEALQAVLSLTDDTFNDFTLSFQRGINGATDAAREIQRDSAAFQFDLLKSQLSELAITIGEVFLPRLNELMRQVRPVIDNVIAWVNANPQLAQTLVMVTVAAIALGPVLIAVGMAISAIGAIIGVVSSPLVLFGLAIAALALAFSTPPEAWAVMWNTMLFYANYAINRIVDFFWDNLAKPIGEALASIPTDTFVGIAVGVGVLGAVLAVWALPAAFTAIATTITATATAFGLSALAAAPFLGILLVIGGLVAAYATNWMGFKDTIDKITESLNAAIYGWQVLLGLSTNRNTQPAAPYVPGTPLPYNVPTNTTIPSYTDWLSGGTSNLGTGTNFNNAGTAFVAGMSNGTNGTKPTASKPGVSVGAININVTGRDDDQHIKRLMIEALEEIAG